jgi:branched-chain amino acid transport system permease protein
MVLFIVASGLTLVFGVMRIANFAHGSLYMFSAYVSFTITSHYAGRDLGFLYSLVLAPITIAVIGAAIEIGLLRRISTRPHQYQLILTFALTLLFSDIVRFLWGPAPLSTPIPRLFSDSIIIFDRQFPIYLFVLIGIGLLIAIALTALSQFSRVGKMVRAAVKDPEMVSALGINVPRLNTSVFAVGAWLAGLGGVLVAPTSAISLQMDTSTIIECFAIVMIGGVGSIPGALLGAIIVSLVQSLGILIAPRLAGAFIFICLCSILVVRPQGLLGRTA